MSDNELVITISGNIDNFKDKLKEASDQTAGLSESLKTAAEVSGVAFAALSLQVFDSLRAFNSADQASRGLSEALQNQGIFTQDLKDKYGEYAEAISKTTGFSEVQITQAQAVAQSFLGQIPVTEELTQAIADMAQKQGISLPAAAEELSKAISNGTGMLLRQGLQFSATDTVAQRYAKTIDFVNLKSGGMAEAANQGIGGIRGLTTAFEEAEVSLGKRFAPIASDVIKYMTDFVKPSKDASDSFYDIKAAAIAVGIVLSGLGVVLPLVANGFLAVRAAMIALSLGAAPLVLIAAAVAALVVGVVELGLHWKQVTGAIKAVVEDMSKTVTTAFIGMTQVIDGALHFDWDKIKAGISKIGDAFKTIAVDAKAGWTAATAETTKAVETQSAIKKAAGDRDAAIKKQHDSIQAQLAKAQDQLILDELRGASASTIALKQEEIKILTSLANSKKSSEIGVLKQQLAEIRALQVQDHQETVAQEAQFAQADLAAAKKLGDQKIKFRDDINKKDLAAIKSKIKTQKDVEQDAYKNELAAQIASDNTFLEEQNKYGEAYAAINQAMHNAALTGSENAFSKLSASQSSGNAVLKTIGKEAAVADIIIKSAQAAMEIYAGFAALPPWIGIPLGIAGAAAAVAFGAEQAAQVQSAADGGLMVGGIPGRDSIPTLTMPGELVVPTRNFDEVVNATADQRSAAQGGSGIGTAEIQLTLKDNLMDFIETKLVQRKFLNLSIQGSR